MWAIEPGASGPALHAWVRGLPVPPKAVVIVSPHWMAPTVEVMAKPQPATWHDFGGFSPRLYELQYPAPGAPELAAQCVALLQAAGLPSKLNTAQDFDHGAWVPMLHAFPSAQVPLIQVAMPQEHSPQVLYAMGRALASLRDEGVLLVGSGSMTHNLREFMQNPVPQNAPAAPYVQVFSRWVQSRADAADHAALLNFSKEAPHAARAHPSIEHFVPLHFALGASSSAEAASWIGSEVMHGVLAMDALAFH